MKRVGLASIVTELSAIRKREEGYQAAIKHYRYYLPNGFYLVSSTAERRQHKLRRHDLLSNEQ